VVAEAGLEARTIVRGPAPAQASANTAWWNSVHIHVPESCMKYYHLYIAYSTPRLGYKAYRRGCRVYELRNENRTHGHEILGHTETTLPILRSQLRWYCQLWGLRFLDPLLNANRGVEAVKAGDKDRQNWVPWRSGM
jgi:hypothetical protein